MMNEFSEDINEYLKCDEVIDFDNTDVSKLADQLYSESERETEFVKMAYEYVRDMISHSADISADTVTCSASEVLKAGHGICFAKSHLLAAILRSKSVPAGFCYQKLILDDETAPVLIYHGLNGVYLREYGKWIRLDQNFIIESNAATSCQDDIRRGGFAIYINVFCRVLLYA